MSLILTLLKPKVVCVRIVLKLESLLALIGPSKTRKKSINLILVGLFLPNLGWGGADSALPLVSQEIMHIQGCVSHVFGHF